MPAFPRAGTGDASVVLESKPRLLSINVWSLAVECHSCCMQSKSVCQLIATLPTRPAPRGSFVLFRNASSLLANFSFFFARPNKSSRISVAQHHYSFVLHARAHVSSLEIDSFYSQWIRLPYLYLMRFALGTVRTFESSFSDSSCGMIDHVWYVEAYLCTFAQKRSFAFASKLVSSFPLRYLIGF